jgi:hypothetical protein
MYRVFVPSRGIRTSLSTLRFALRSQRHISNLRLGRAHRFCLFRRTWQIDSEAEGARGAKQGGGDG